MGGIMTPSKEEEIMKFLRQDDSKKLQEFIIKNQLSPDQLYTKHNRTLIQLCCYFESPKCLSQLIDMNYDYNQVESSNGNSPLFISCKFNCLSIVKILLEKDDCKKLVKNDEKFNEFDIAFLKGNYPICYYLLYEYKNKNDIKNIKKNEKNKNNKNKENMDENLNINTNMNLDINKNENNYDYDINQIYQNYFFNNDFDIDTFMYLQETNKYPLFNMPLFFQSLCQKIPPKDCPRFDPERKKTKELMTKIPDPNETWGHFFKRIVNLELYNPPLVDRKNVTQMNSMYMNTQMKLIENEYGIKMKYYNPNIDNDTDMVDEEQTPIIKIKKKSNKSKNNNNINKENDKKENENKNNEENDENGRNENLGILKVNNFSSERNINNINNDE